MRNSPSQVSPRRLQVTRPCELPLSCPKTSGLPSSRPSPRYAVSIIERVLIYGFISTTRFRSIQRDEIQGHTNTTTLDGKPKPKAMTPDSLTGTIPHKQLSKDSFSVPSPPADPLNAHAQSSDWSAAAILPHLYSFTHLYKL